MFDSRYCNTVLGNICNLQMYTSTWPFPAFTYPLQVRGLVGSGVLGAVKTQQMLRNTALINQNM